MCSCAEPVLSKRVMEHDAWNPSSEAPDAWEHPCFEVISLSCEITAYAPDDEPLF